MCNCYIIPIKFKINHNKSCRKIDVETDKLLFKKDFIEEVKVKYISNFNNLGKEAIEVKSDTERACEVTEINSKEMSLHITDTKIGTTTEVWLHKPKVKFRVYDLTNQLGVDPKFEQYVKESQKACLDLLKIKEEQKEKQRAEKQISLLKN